MLKASVRLQDEYDCFLFVADWHAMTDNPDASMIREYARQIGIDWLSVGADPDKSILFVQSQVPEHAELEVLLSMITTVPRLERCPTYKDHIQSLSEKENPSLGKLAYPVLQTADIIIYKAVAVPVGEDQLAHLEISREIARRFNSLYGDVFPEPQAVPGASLPGLDGRKMSKSYGNCIYLSDSAEEITSKVMNMFTDPERVRRSDPGHPERCPVHAYHSIYNPDEADEIAEKCRKALIGCVDCKRILAERIVPALAGIQEKRKHWESEDVEGIMAEGSRRARQVAQETMKEVREAMNMSY
jgi:tryptophanyl-tRNA synthetase